VVNETVEGLAFEIVRVEEIFEGVCVIMREGARMVPFRGISHAEICSEERFECKDLAIFPLFSKWDFLVSKEFQVDDDISYDFLSCSQFVDEYLILKVFYKDHFSRNTLQDSW
jgi:hypothetical protein